MEFLELSWISINLEVLLDLLMVCELNVGVVGFYVGVYVGIELEIWIFDGGDGVSLFYISFW